MDVRDDGALLPCIGSTPIKSYPSKSFHRRWGYRFKRPVHEALFFTGEEITRDCDGIVMHHLRTTPANHEQYLGLMELAHKEDPKDAQICFWLGRECMWAKRNERGTEVLERYLVAAVEHMVGGAIRGDALPSADADGPQDGLVGQGPDGGAAPARDLAGSGRGVPWQGGLVEPFLGVHKRNPEDAPHRELSR